MWWGKLIYRNIVTHSSGRAEVSTTSASIRWIRPSYMYPDESSRVVVYCLMSHNMLGWIECMILWNYIGLDGWNILCFSLPYFYLLCVLLCGTFFCDDHQLVDVSRCEEHPRTTGRWWFRCMICMGWILVFFRALSHVSRYALFSIPVFVRLFNCLLSASWCAQLVGVGLRTPRLLYRTICVWRFF